MQQFKLVYENEKSNFIEFGTDRVKIIKFDGFGDVPARVQTQRYPYQDGSSHIDTFLQERPIYLEFLLRGEDYIETSSLRRLISSNFNPKLSGRLTLSYGGKSFEIEGKPEHVPFFPDKGSDSLGKIQTGSINLICPDPYWRDPNQTSKPLQAYVGNFTLPFTLPFELGVSGSRTTLYNEGDVPAPVRIDIQGPVTNPQIINRTTGEWVRINRAIAADEILHIDTTDGRKRVEIYRGNEVFPALGYMDHDSDWIKLELGENEIEHIADAGDRNSLVAVTWNSQYVGV